MQDAKALMIEYRAAVEALQRAMAEAADPSLTAMQRLDQVTGLRPLWAHHDEIRRQIEAIYR